MDKLLYRPREAALILGMSKTALYDLIRTNRIRSIKDGKFRFITADALREYVRTLEQRYEEVSLDASEWRGKVVPEAPPLR
jgi:excisionase family DNA binding protein